MKIKILAFILCVLAATPAVSVFANSAPIYHEKSVPQTAMLAVDENCPIKVNREELLFDFTAETNHKNRRYICRKT